MPFQCVQCGCCCRAVTLHPDLAHLAKPDGSCVYLMADMRCGIYEVRPDACQIDKAFERTNGAISREQYDAVTALACLHLMKEYGAPEEKRERLVQLLLEPA